MKYKINFSKLITSSLLILLLVIIDQITKNYIIKNLQLGEQIQINPFFNLTLVYNKGVSFGMLNNYDNANIILTLTVIFIITYLIYLIIKEKIYIFPYLLVISGAVGNLIDRFKIGAVVDFLDFHYNHYHWPAFNVADSVIVIGVFLLITRQFKKVKEGNYV